MANTKHSFAGRAMLIYEDTSTGQYGIASYNGISVASDGTPTLPSTPSVPVMRYKTKQALVDALHAVVKPEEQD